jgi:hypothetical protein
MIQRALSLSASAIALALVSLGNACSSGSSSMEATDGGAGPASSSSSGGSSGNASADGLWGFSRVAGLASDEARDSGNDVTFLEAGRMEAGTEGGSADGPSLDANGSEAGVETGTVESEASSSETGVEAASVETGAEAGSEAGLEAGEDPDAGCVNLTVENVLVWCSISVNGSTPSAAPVQVVCVPPGTQQLAATALVDFELGPWHDTAGDMGQGDPGTVTGTGQSAVISTTVVVGDDPKCVWICCPYTDGDGCPPANQDQCP